MVQDKKTARQNYDRLSRFYDQLAGRGEQRLRQSGLQALAIQPGEHVLEIGCGTGQALEEITQLVGPTGAGWGVDLSGGMAAVARKRLAGLSPSGRVCVAVADAVQLPFIRACFDVVWMAFTLELFAELDAQAVLKECRRVLSPGGRLGVVSLACTSRPGWMERSYTRAHQAFPAVIDCCPIDLAGVLQEAGFAPVSSRRYSLWELPVMIVLAK